MSIDLQGHVSREDVSVRVNAGGTQQEPFPVIDIASMRLILRSKNARDAADACLEIAKKFVEAAVELSPDQVRGTALIATMRLLDSAHHRPGTEQE